MSTARVTGKGGTRTRPDRGTRLPAVVLVGIVLIVVGFVQALVAAMAPPEVSAGHANHDVHLLAFVGMVLVFIGVLSRARARGSDGRGRTAHQEDSDAVR